MATYANATVVKVTRSEQGNAAVLRTTEPNPEPPPAPEMIEVEHVVGPPIMDKYVEDLKDALLHGVKVDAQTDESGGVTAVTMPA